MKQIITICILSCMTTIYAQNRTTYGFLTNEDSQSQTNEKRIKFNKGVLKICTSSNMNISGYDGDEVIIKSRSRNRLITGYRTLSDSSSTLSKTVGVASPKSNNSVALRNYQTAKGYYYIGNLKERELEKGLKPLGNKSTNPADNLYLDIEEKNGELIIKDYAQEESGANTFFYHNNAYELLIPNSIKLLWNVDNCQKTKSNTNTFVIRSNSNPWQLSDFKGEVEISSSYSGVTLSDVVGPVLVNTIGGNIKVVFDKTTPKNLYSLISKDGYINVELPSNSSLNIDAKGDRILSDIDFKINEDDIVDGQKKMRLQLNSGTTKMKIDSGSGSIYLRKSN